MQLANTQHQHRKRALLIVGAIVLAALAATAVAYASMTRKVHTSATPANTHAQQVEQQKTPTPPPAPNYCASNTSGKLLLVNITQQHMWACDGTQLAHESAVTTGITTNPNGVDDNTPVGTWHILSKYTNVTIRGSDANGSWNDHVDYWMPFIGTEYGFHDAAWQTFPFGDQQYHADGSHGCVHLPIDTMAWVYDWAPVGTTVTIQS